MTPANERLILVRPWPTYLKGGQECAPNLLGRYLIIRRQKSKEPRNALIALIVDIATSPLPQGASLF